MKTSILIVSAGAQTNPFFEGVLGKMEPVFVHDLSNTPKILKRRHFDICFVQVDLSKKAQFHPLRQIQKSDGSIDLLVALEQTRIPMALEILGKHWDYLTIPYSSKELKLKLEKMLTKRSLERENHFWRIELATLLADRGTLSLEDMPAEIWERTGGEAKIEGKFFKRSRRVFERECFRRALARAQGSQTQAAKALGIHRNTLIWKLKKLNLTAECQKMVRKRRGH